MILFKKSSKYLKYSYSSEEEFENEIVINSKKFFGSDIIYIEAKRKIDSKALGVSIPDGFLFDLADKDNPNFYLVEIELASHDFYKHIFPQITKFFAFFRSSKNRNELVEKIFSFINSNNILKKEFKKYLGHREIYKFIKDILDDSQNILLIIDGEKRELPEIMETYNDTWGKMVKLLVLKKFIYKNEYIYSLEPEFEKIEYSMEESVEEGEALEQFTEGFHLDGVSTEIKDAYIKIKEGLLNFNKEIKFNPQKYYISIVHKKNIAYFIFRKKKVRLVIILPEEEIRKRIHKNKVKALGEGVQRFYNNPCAEIIIERNVNLKEVIELIKDLASH